MKLMGHLENGHVMLECEEREYLALQILVETAKGKTFPYYIEHDARNPLNADVEAFLSAIREWLDVKDRANVLRNIASEIDAAVGMKS